MDERMKHFFQSTLVVVATLVSLVLAWELREALILFILSLAVAASTRGPANFWIKRGMPRGLAIILTYALLVIFLLLGITLAGGPILHDLQQVTDAFDRRYQQILSTWPTGTLFQQMVAKQLPAPQDLYDAITGEQGAELLQDFLGAASGFMEDVTKLLIILVLSIYWSFDRLHSERIWISLLPADQRKRAREIWRKIEDGVGGYIQSEVLQSVIAGLLLGFGYYSMGLNYPALIALIGALLWLIPWVGALLALILPLLAGLTSGIPLGIIATIYTALVLAFLELAIEPRMFDRRKYSSLLVVIVLAVMTEEYGLIGLLLAPPLAAAIQILYTNLAQQPAPVVQEDMALKVDSLRQRVKNLKFRVGRLRENSSPEVVNLLGRLDSVMEQADNFIEGERQAFPKIR